MAVVDPVLALHAEEVVVDQTIVVETTAVVLAMVVAMAVVADVAVKTTNSDDAHVTMTIMNLDEGQKMMIMSLECAQGIVPHQDNLHRLRDRVPGQLIRETSQEEQTRETTTKQDRRGDYISTKHEHSITLVNYVTVDSPSSMLHMYYFGFKFKHLSLRLRPKIINTN